MTIAIGFVLTALIPAAPLQDADGSPTIYSMEVLPSHLPTQPAIAVRLNGLGAVVGFGLESGWFQGAHWPGDGTVIDLAARHG